MKADERTELFEIILPKWSNAVTEILGNHRSNFAIFGNDYEHLHAHLIPRFFEDISFE